MRFVTNGSAILVCLLFAGILAKPARAVGPAVIAKADISLWSGRLDSRAGFDRASRAYLLAYALSLVDMGRLSDAAMLKRFHIHSVNHNGVQKWLKHEEARTWRNYQLASRSCVAGGWSCVGGVDGFAALARRARDWRQNLPGSRLAWFENAKAFSSEYVGEQMRLAALFPKVSSEIGLFNANEWNGGSLPDRRFYLSFDDGPAPPDGNTGATLKMLARYHKSGVFFLIGSKLEARLKHTDAKALRGLYRHQCVGSHGWKHKSHARWARWQYSIRHTRALLHKVFSPDEVQPLFRPPYGQRKADSGAFFKQEGLHVALWDLDSQDWNRHVSATDAVNRMLALMLIKRHGVLLFHDIHGKAKVALPIIFQKLGSAVDFGDCHRLAAL